MPAEAVRFRELLAKVGSGEHTSTGLTRAEAREAMDLMLLGQVSDAQLGAFLIAHRIRRPSPIELTGMLDSYRALGPTLVTPGRSPLALALPTTAATARHRCCRCWPWCWRRRISPWCCMAAAPCR